jgi:hypothetical protein
MGSIISSMCFAAWNYTSLKESLWDHCHSFSQKYTPEHVRGRHYAKNMVIALVRLYSWGGGGAGGGDFKNRVFLSFPVLKYVIIAELLGILLKRWGRGKLHFKKDTKLNLFKKIPLLYWNVKKVAKQNLPMIQLPVCLLYRFHLETAFISSAK